MLGRLELPQGDDVVVASETHDDAAVIRMPDGRGLVQTVDFFTPIVDDPFDWGRIAAANAFSDVYAMGGRPAYALNLVAWPIEELSTELLSDVLRGGAKVAAEAGVAIVGGHSIHDPEPKYGMSVTGFIEDLSRMTRNSTVPAGARLFLTKPLGLGIQTTAIKRGTADPARVALAVETMTTLNAAAADAMLEAGVAAATDVTGFGLLGHLHQMLLASGVAAELDASEVPLLPGTLELAAQGVVPDGTKKNLRFVEPHLAWDLPPEERLVLADAQTSGGLLLAIDPSRAPALRAALEARSVLAAEIGEAVAGEPGRIAVRGRLRP